MISFKNLDKGRGRDGEERVGRDEEHCTVSWDTFGLHSEAYFSLCTALTALACLFLLAKRKHYLTNKQLLLLFRLPLFDPFVIPSAKERKTTAQTQNKSTSSLSVPFVHHKSNSSDDKFL